MHIMDMDLHCNWLVAFATLLGDVMAEPASAVTDPGVSPLSPSAAAMLLTVEHRQPLPVSAAAAVLGISQPTATRLADGLARAGLLFRGDKAGRAVPLMLTAAGRTRAGHLAEAMQARVGKLLDALDAAERRAFMGAVAKILTAATGSREQARTICRNCDHGVCHGADCPVGSRANALDAVETGV